MNALSRGLRNRRARRNDRDLQRVLRDAPPNMRQEIIAASARSQILHF